MRCNICRWMLAAVLTILLTVGGAGALEPVTGDLNGDGTDSYGTFDPSTAGFTFNGKTVHFGTSTDLPVMGDWDHDGKDEIGVFRPDEGGQSKFYLITRDWATFSDGANAGAADKTIPFGYYPNNIPIAGDWDGDGDDDIGGFNPDNNNFYLYILNLPSSSATSYAPRPSVSFGTAGDTPIIGDWDGDGDDDVGIFRSLDPNPSTNSFYLDLSLTGGQHELGPYLYGNVGDKPVAGDWDRDGDDNIGVYRPSTEQFYTDSNIPLYPMPLYVTVSESPDPVTSGGTSQVTVLVTTTGDMPVSGASVSVSATGGSLSPTSGTTDANGNFKPTYTAPTVTTTQTHTISATTSKAGYTSGSGSDTITVHQSGTTLIIVDDDGPADYNTIQAAVNAASTGDTIEVRSGTYIENVDVGKRLTLIGDGADVVSVQAANPNDYVFFVSAAEVSVSGFTLTGATGYQKAGMRCTKGCVIFDNNVSNNYWGIWKWGSSTLSTILINNTVNSNFKGGILMWDSNSSLIDNSVNSNGDGPNCVGIQLQGSNHTLINNTVNLNNRIGIWLVQGSSNSTFINNTVSNSNWGILIQASFNNTLTGNTVSNNSDYGIYLQSFTDNTYLYHNRLYRNNLIDNKYGIYLRFSGGNNLTDNIANSNSYGISLFSSSNNNTLYHNSLIDNTYHNAYDTGTNQWDSGSEGNHYGSDYSGTDSDGDGIGDTPHPIPGGSSVDRYPLMAPYTPHTDPQDRSLVQVEGESEVYWFQNGRLYWVTDWNVINDMSGVPGWDGVNTLPASEFNPADYPQGPRFITTGAESDGLLIRQVGDYKVYHIENGKKRHITYPDVMDLKGYSFDDIIEVSSEISDMFPLGDPIGIEVDLYFNKLTGLVESSRESQFTTGDTIKFITETTAGADYTVETYVRLTYPDGITKKFAYHEKSDLSDQLKFSDTERPFYPGTWDTQTKIWNWNEYTFTGDETEGIYTWEFWYKDTASGKILGKDVQGYEFSISPPDPIDITPPKIIILPVLGITTDGITYYNSNVYISGTAFDPSGIKTLTVNGQGLWSIPVYGVKVFGSFINLNEGINEITISAIDNSENSNEKIEKININYYPYNVKINSPKDGSIFKEGDSIKLEGKVTDGTPQFDYKWIINGEVKNSGTSDNGLIEHTLNGLALGEYKVKLKVTDSKGYIFETNEIQIFIKEPKPDLIVTDISFSKDNQEIKEVAEGEPIIVTARIKNVGPVNVNTPFWLSFDQSSHYTNYESNEIGFDALIKKVRIDQLTIGESKDIKISWNAAPVKTDRDGSIRLFVDRIEEIDEIDENNNIKYGKIEITSRSKFKPEVDGYQFKNYPYTFDEMLKLQEDLEKITFPSIYIQEFLISWINLHFGEGGSCYGMSASSVLYYEGWEKPVDDITFNMLKDDVDVKINIIDAQVFQWASGLFNGFISPRIFTNIEEDYNNKIKPQIEKGTPVVLWITLDGNGHAVVAYDIYDVSDKIKNVLVYDSNYPGMGRVIEFDFNNKNINYVNVNENFELYKVGYQNTLISDMGFNYPQKIVKDAIRDLFKNLFDNNKKMNLFFSPINVTMVDQYGRIINDNGVNNIPDASYNSIGHIKLFSMPIELDYTINIEAYDSGDFSFVQINPLTDEYACEVSFKDIPINENSKASIDIGSMILDYFMFIDYDGDGVTDEIKTPDNIEIIGAEFYNITFLPPIPTMDKFNLKDGSTLPIKFTAKNSSTNEFIYDDTVNVTITNSTGHLIAFFTNGTCTDSVRINSTEEQYIVNFHTKDYDLNVGETYTIHVTFGEADALRGYAITHFTLVDNKH